MSKQHDRITHKFADNGMAWAVRSDKYCGANDPLDDQIAGRKTYHVHPDASYPDQNSIMQFGSLAEIESYLAARAEADANPDKGWEIMQDWHASHA